MPSSSYASLTPDQQGIFHHALNITFKACLEGETGQGATSRVACSTTGLPSRDEIIAGLRLYPEGPVRDVIADAIKTCCLGGSDCAVWDVLEAADGKLRADRPANCPRVDAIPSDCMNLSAGAKQKLCADLPCSVPPFSSVRCWLPYGILGLVVGFAGGAVVMHLVAKRRSKRS